MNRTNESAVTKLENAILVAISFSICCPCNQAVFRISSIAFPALALLIPSLTVLIFPTTTTFPLASSVVWLFFMSFPVAVLNRANALSVALAGQTTSPVPPPVEAPRNAL